MLEFRTVIHDAHRHRGEFRCLNEATEGLFKVPPDPRTHPHRAG